jgi:hypothetical protein
MPDHKPSTVEEEYFAREDALKRQKLALERQKELAEEHKAELKRLHHGHCPNCGMELHELKFRGFDVDKCFNCGGTWLDAGELEKLAEPEHGAVMGSVLNWFKTSR